MLVKKISLTFYFCKYFANTDTAPRNSFNFVEARLKTMRHSGMKLRSALTLLLLTMGISHAGPAPGSSVEWDHTFLHLPISLGQTYALGSFAYANRSSQPLAITEVRPSCGCTVADYPDQALKPGQRGELNVVFDYGDRSGLQRHTITVNFDDGSRHTLVVTAEVPQAIQTDRRMLRWRGDSVAPQTLRLVLHSDLRNEPERVVVQAEGYTHRIAWETKSDEEVMPNSPLTGRLELEPNEDAPARTSMEVRVSRKDPDTDPLATVSVLLLRR